VALGVVHQCGEQQCRAGVRAQLRRPASGHEQMLERVEALEPRDRPQFQSRQGRTVVADGSDDVNLREDAVSCLLHDSSGKATVKVSKI
jgi:hypothetical protein